MFVRALHNGIFLLQLVLCAQLAAPLAAALPSIPSAPREHRAVWMASVSNIDWPSATGQSATTQKNALTTMMDKLVALNINAVYLQVRPASDALYASSIEPWSQYLSGTQGNNPGYDPLAFAVTEAHKRGLELHAWINPYRVSTGTTSSSKAINHISRTRPDLTRIYDGKLFLDPGEADSATHVKSVVQDIVARYDIDGIVFDDYFYPYPTSAAFPDTTSYAKYTNAGGTMSKSDWRRDNVNRLVRDVYQLIHATKAHVEFQIGPFGIWRPGNPSGVTGLDSYADIYADSRKWLQQGWVDAISPQLYWVLSSTGQPYGKLVDWWCQQNTAGRLVYVSNYTSKAGTSGWPSSEIVNQVLRTRTSPSGKGNVHFSSKALTNDQSGVATALKNGPYATPALQPQMPWLDSVAPASPAVSVGAPTGSPVRRTVSFAQPAGAEAATSWGFYTYESGAWKLTVLPGLTVSRQIDPAVVQGVAVTAVDRSGNESARVIQDFTSGVDEWVEFADGVD